MLRSKHANDDGNRDRQRAHPPLYHQPHPPAAQPNRTRRSNIGRQRAARANSLPSGVTPSPQTSRTVSPASPPPTIASRPLSRYRILPSISGDNEVSRRSQSVSEAEVRSDITLKLALRLPDGRRVQNTFNSFDSLESLLAYGLKEMSDDGETLNNLEEGRRMYELVAAGERRVLSDWNRSFHELGIADRSLYILQETE